MELVVGIFSREGDSSYRFLSDALRAEDSVRDVRSFTITNNGLQRLQEEASRCHRAILYHSKNRGRLNITNVTDSLYDDEIEHLSTVMGKKNVIVVADDLDDSSPEVKMKILQSQPLIGEMAAELFLFSKTDKNSQNLLDEKLQKISSRITSHKKVSKTSEQIRPTPKPEGLQQLIYNIRIYNILLILLGPVLLIYYTVTRGIRKMQELVHYIWDTVTWSVRMPWGLVLLICNIVTGGIRNTLAMELVVGIFSREGDSSYRFLSDALRAEDSIRDVRSFTITNNGLQRLQEEASRCHRAILYHSKNRGRLNITNVTDSLYDDEIKHLSTVMGKKNVIVVVDDLDDSSPEVKMKILQSQPLIEEMAGELFLFSKTDKNSQNILDENLQKISSYITSNKKVSKTSEQIRPTPILRGLYNTATQGIRDPKKNVKTG